ncbi:hypothetical protein D3C76_1606190 [compost metagenome]
MWALLHKKLGHGPVHLTFLEPMSEMKALDHLVGTWFHHSQGDGFDQATGAHRTINTAGLGS